jgi:DNA-binding MarR family transcriptional regulator
MGEMTSHGELERKLLAAADRLGRALRAARQPVGTRHGLSLLQVLAIEQLAARGARRVGELAGELDVTQATASETIASLETKGVVTRRRDDRDGRATVVSLTPAGVELAAVIEAELAAITDAERRVQPVSDADANSADADTAVALRVLLGEIGRLQRAGVITVNRSCLTCAHYRAPDAGRLAHCGLMDAPLFDRDLRVDCPEHVAVVTR